MNQIWWRLRESSGEILPVKIQRVTESMVTLESGKRAMRKTGWYSYYPTWEEAHAALVHARKMQLERAQVACDRAREALKKSHAMHKPIFTDVVS